MHFEYIRIPNDCIKIWITDKGEIQGFAVINSVDRELIEGHSWHLVRYSDFLQYAATYIRGKRVFLHQLLMGRAPKPGLVIDHANREGLDCRRSNLRWATVSQNSLNRRCTSATGFYGVTATTNGKFRAMALEKHLGIFDLPKDASMARSRYVRATARPADLPFIPFDFDELGNPIVVQRFDHMIQPHTARVKACSGRGVSKGPLDKNGAETFIASLCFQGVKRRERFWEEAQAQRNYDEWRVAVGLPRVNYPDVIATINCAIRISQNILVIAA